MADDLQFFLCLIPQVKLHFTKVNFKFMKLNFKFAENQKLIMVDTASIR